MSGVQPVADPGERAAPNVVAQLTYTEHAGLVQHILTVPQVVVLAALSTQVLHLAVESVDAHESSAFCGKRKVS